MQFGDIKYTFVDNSGVQQSVLVPSQIIREGKKSGLSNKEAIVRYLKDEGYDVTVTTTTKKVATAKKKSTRKPNETKATLVDAMVERMSSFGEVTVINEERQLQVNIDGVIYEWTLVQKRKKN